MDLQEAIERFLSDTERRRSDVTVKRYGEAMDLFQSYLALELIDPDSIDQAVTGRVEHVTPQSIGKFINEFLGERLQSNDRARKRYIAATRSFVQWLVRGNLLSGPAGEQIVDILRQASRGLDHRSRAGGGESADEGEASALVLKGSLGDIGPDESYYQVLDVTDSEVQLLDIETANEVRGEVPAEVSVQPGDLVAAVLTRRRGRVWATQLRVLVEEQEFEDADEVVFGGIDWENGEEPSTSEDDDWVGGTAPMVEDALEILASEDRYAPREVVRVILTHFDEARDDLQDWLTDDDYRNEPFPGAGEAPANAARILSEVGDDEAVERLVDVLGASDPLGEEAPLALARYEPPLLEPVAAILSDASAALSRRIAALWSLAFMAARNPAVRRTVSEQLLRHAVDGPRKLGLEVLSALEEMRAVEVLDTVRSLADKGELDLESLDRTVELFESRVSEPGWGERFHETFMPVLFLYPTSEELEEFYESLEEDLGEFWDLMGLEESNGEPDEDDSGDDEDDEPEGGGKVIPFRRPRS